MKTKLLAVESDKYLRRMIREINSRLRSGDSVSVTNFPFPKKVCRVVYGPNLRKIIVTDSVGLTSAHDADGFTDGSGFAICASRAQ